ncbi:MAG TPA: hypothetical protein VHU80_18915 [Polyangiaceae bacterium]|nr:hypothetical protein [Polyangiaceae bacterium]
MTLDPANGLVNIVAIQSAASADAGTAAPGFDFTTGVSFAVTPKSGVGPFYVTPEETFAPTAKATVGGYGAWFLNLAPGTYEATATASSMTCSGVPGSGYGWPGDAGVSKFPILADFDTQTVLFFCAPK